MNDKWGKGEKRKTVEKRKRGGRLRRNLILKGGNMNLEGGGDFFGKYIPLRLYSKASV